MIPVVLSSKLDEKVRFRELDHLLEDRKLINILGQNLAPNVLRIAHEVEQVATFGSSTAEQQGISEYLIRYVAREEPPIHGNGNSTHI